MVVRKGVIVKQTVGVNEFVRRQVKGTGKTYTKKETRIFMKFFKKII